VREQARQSLFGVLCPKSNFAICYTNFVESIFVLNEVSSHTTVSALTSLSTSSPSSHAPLLAFALTRRIEPAALRPQWLQHVFQLHRVGARSVFARRFRQRGQAKGNLPHASASLPRRASFPGTHTAMCVHVCVCVCMCVRACVRACAVSSE
jgi:hypothetical protein